MLLTLFESTKLVSDAACTKVALTDENIEMQYSEVPKQ
jgi:hypothetical protein